MNKKIFKILLYVINIIFIFIVISFIIDKSHLLYFLPRIKTIKNLIPFAVEKVAEKPQCYKVLNADVSYEYSNEEQMVFYVDCSTSDNIFNIERFFVTEDEIKKNNK